MTAQEVIDTVHEIDDLIAQAVKAEAARIQCLRKVAELRQKLEGLAGRVTPSRLAIKGKRRESPRQDAIRALILRKPTTTYRDIVMELYGEATETNILNARSLVSNMKKANQIAGEPGAWRVVQPDVGPELVGDEDAA